MHHSTLPKGLSYDLLTAEFRSQAATDSLHKHLFMSQTGFFFAARMRRLFCFDGEDPSAAQKRFWFVFSMLYAATCAVLALRQAFASEYVLADDVRQHVFWMFRFLDPKLFPGDPIANYFQSIGPPGFVALYRFFATLGIDPLLASKLIPFGLGLVTAGFFFGAALRILRSPVTAALATILLCQCLWLSSDLCSATPRAFFYPLFVAFIYYHVRRSRLAVLIVVFLQGFFFPPAALVTLGVIGLDLVEVNDVWPRFTRDYRSYVFCISAIVIALLAIVPYLSEAEKFGRMVTYGQAQQMPEFARGGRVPFFYTDLWNYWMHGAGGLHIQSRPSCLFAAFLWPIFAFFPRAFPSLGRTRAQVLLRIVAAALILFAISHALLFRLYLPSRYTQHTGRIMLAVAAAAVIMAFVDLLLRLSARRTSWITSSLAFGFASLLLLWIICFPLFLSHFPRVSYITGNAPNLYRFFAAQPKTIRIASIADEANNLPAFSHRIIIFGVETAVPFHPGYYLPLRQRGLAIASAQYSPDLAVVQQCIRDQHIDFWLLDRGAFTAEHLLFNRVLRLLRLKIPDHFSGAAPFLEHPPPQCVVFADPHFIVLDARAILAL